MFRIVEIAHPEDRAELVDQAKQAKLLYPDQNFMDASTWQYPGHISETHTFKNKVAARFRPIKPSDEEQMRRLFYRFSDKAVYYRCFSPVEAMPQVKNACINTKIQKKYFLDPSHSSNGFCRAWVMNFTKTDRDRILQQRYGAKRLFCGDLQYRLFIETISTGRSKSPNPFPNSLVNIVTYRNILVNTSDTTFSMTKIRRLQKKMLVNDQFIVYRFT